MSLMFSGLRAFNNLKSLAYERLGGTEGEFKASEFLKEGLIKLSYEVKVEEFEVQSYKVLRSKLEVLEPLREEVPCVGVGLSEDTAEDGVEGMLAYIESGDRRLMAGVEGSIFLIYGSLDRERYEEVLRGKPKALVFIEPSPGREPSRVELLPEWWPIGKVPMVRISYEDGLKLLKHKAGRVKLSLRQEVVKAKSRNVIADKKGLRYPEELVIVCGHYDSAPATIGACDNAGGAAIILELANIFSSRDFKRSLRFIFFGSEELGLRGSRDYVERHKEELKDVKLVVNLDVHGQVFGGYSAIVAGPSELKSYAEALGKELGLRLSASEDVMSSDCAPFNKAEVPSISFYRSGGSSFYIHSPEDSLKHVGQEALEAIGHLVEVFLSRILEAEFFPFGRDIPESTKKKVTEYFEKRLGVREEAKKSLKANSTPSAI